MAMAKNLPFSIPASVALASAYDFARTRHHSRITTRHMLFGLAQADTLARSVLSKILFDREYIILDLTLEIEVSLKSIVPKPFVRELRYSKGACAALECAQGKAQAEKDARDQRTRKLDIVGGDHLLLGIMYANDKAAHLLRDSYGITLKEIEREMRYILNLKPAQA
jgi:ATP-dependent Clp protease ATP-binding subunit ClpA